MFLLLFSYACFGESPFEDLKDVDWETADIDQDGWTIADGDCWESSTQPTRVEGAEHHSLTSADIYPTAEDRSYDGVDANCDGSDDFDDDGDGFVPDEYEGIETLEIAGSGSLPAGDCWDLMDDSIPEDFRVLNGFVQLARSEVFPNRRDRFYDGINQDCGSVAFEFDQDHDGDGYAGNSYGLSANFSCLDLGFSNESTDCDDSSLSTYPWAPESMGSHDENCDGMEIQGYVNCSGGWKLGDYYLICDGDEDYEEAEDICTIYGYDHLTWIFSNDVNDFIYGYLALGQSYWIGLSDRSIEGVFFWSGYNLFIPFYDWFMNEPNNYNNQDCVSIGINGWSDQSCSTERGFICQIR